MAAKAPKKDNVIRMPDSDASSVAERPSEEILEAILIEAFRNIHRGVPVLVGPTQYGKTFFLNDVLHRRMGIPRKNIVMFNPQNDLPEDIGGWPLRDGQWLNFTQPANIPPRLLAESNYDGEGNPKEPWAIFVDEIDKAREETLSAMLTFFNPDERRLRTTRIHARVPIVGAMNEPENRIIPEPLLARLLFLPYPPPGIKVSSRPGLRALEGIANELYNSVPEVKFPARPRAPGSLHKLAEWVDTSILWESQLARQWIVRGLFNEADTAVVLARLRERLPEPSEEWAKAVTPTQMIEHLIKVLDSGSYDADVKVLQALEVRTRKENDPTGEMERLLTAFLMCPEALHAVHRDKHLPEGIAALKKKVSELDKAAADAVAKEASKQLIKILPDDEGWVMLAGFVLGVAVTRLGWMGWLDWTLR